jgi:hypothetical protein
MTQNKKSERTRERDRIRERDRERELEEEISNYRENRRCTETRGSDFRWPKKRRGKRKVRSPVGDAGSTP